MLFLQIRLLSVDLVVRIDAIFQLERILTMRLIKPFATIVTILLLLSVSTSFGQHGESSPLAPPFAQADAASPARFSEFVGDTAESEGDTLDQAGVSSHAADEGDSGYAGFVGDGSATGFSSFTGDEQESASEHENKDLDDWDKNLDDWDKDLDAWGKGDSCKAASSSSQLYNTWVSFEYMHTWLQARSLPPLVTTSPPGVDGILPGSRTLYGGDVGGDLNMGGRLTVGTWLGPQERFGLVGEFFSFEGEGTGFAQASNASGSPLLARPFFDTSPGSDEPGSLRISGVYDNDTLVLQGFVDAATKTDVLTADAYCRALLACYDTGRLDLIAGYQFARVDDYLRINNQSVITANTGAPGIPVGSRVAFSDVFDVRNKFHGGQIGLLGEFGRGPITLTMIAKTGLGNMNEVVTINGASSIAIPTGGGAYSQSDFVGGHLAQPTNIGVYKRDRFTWIPEAEVKLTWCLSEHLDFSLGYALTYFADLALAGDQIETVNGLPVVNRSQWFGGSLVGPPNPSLPEIRESSLWLQGLTLGLTIKL